MSSFNGRLLPAIGTTARDFLLVRGGSRTAKREFGSEPVEGGRSRLLEAGEDDGSVDGSERMARFLLTSTA